jgi:prophage maintenance system killer protein
LVFLELNGIDTDAIDENEMEALTCAVAEGKADKQLAAEFFRGHIAESSE